MKTKKKKDNQIPKFIILGLQTIQFISKNWVTNVCVKLFSTPIKHKIPKREFEMNANSKQELVFIPELNKKIMVYQYGNSPKKVLLVHGWSGRGTQLVKFADELIKLGYSTISFDAPAHGKSEGQTTLMTEFIASILEIEKQYGSFQYAIGHSLGSMSLLNSIKKGLNLEKLVIIGSGDKISDILNDFISKVKLKPEIALKMQKHYEARFGEPMSNYDAHKAAKHVNIPTLVIHDQDDKDVPAYCGENIHKHLPNGSLMLTKKLGHRKILGDEKVIQQTIDFLLSN